MSERIAATSELGMSYNTKGIFIGCDSLCFLIRLHIHDTLNLQNRAKLNLCSGHVEIPLRGRGVCWNRPIIRT
jgi:hypothetical protein